MVETSTHYADATETLTVATITTTSFFIAMPTMKKRTFSPSTSATVSCPTLASKNLVHHPASRLSQACSCLGVEAETVTVTVGSTVPAVTTTLTATSVQTEVVSETSVVTATTVDVSVVDATATTSVRAAQITAPLADTQLTPPVPNRPPRFSPRLWPSCILTATATTGYRVSTADPATTPSTPQCKTLRS